LRELYWQDLKQKVDTLLLSGKRVFIVYPVPELPLSITKLGPLSIFSNQSLLDLNNTLPRSYYEQRNAYILAKLDSLPFNDKLVAVKPASVLCDEQHCAAVKHDKAMYFDDDHLSVSGASAVAEMITNRALLTAN
ncbi:MAG: acyltransferase, partial [Gammaproteobacteria bacterium]|nr:acyltransferase [Gammaproteobacteria bacterium]